MSVRDRVSAHDRANVRDDENVHGHESGHDRGNVHDRENVHDRGNVHDRERVHVRDHENVRDDDNLVGHMAELNQDKVRVLLTSEVTHLLFVMILIIMTRISHVRRQWRVQSGKRSAAGQNEI